MIITKENVGVFFQEKGEKDIANIVAASGGDWSQAYFFEVGGREMIIRFSDYDEDFLKDKYAHRFSSTQLPIPEIEEVGSAFGGHYAISAKIDGKMIDHLSEFEMQQFTPGIFELFNALRKADLSATTGFGNWDHSGKGTSESWKSFLRGVNRFDGNTRVDWRAGLAQRPETSALFEKVYQEMERLLEYCPEERYLIHNDLLHLNLLVKDNKVAGVIDWGCSLYGDFLYDLAMFDLWQFYYPAMEGIDFRAEALAYFENAGVALPNFSERLKCYQCHLALDSIKYSAFKGNDKNLNLISNRIKEVIG